MVNEPAPSLPKLLFTESLTASIADIIPTRDVMPIAMMAMVRDDRSLFAFTAFRETLKFSLKRVKEPGENGDFITALLSVTMFFLKSKSRKSFALEKSRR